MNLNEYLSNPNVKAFLRVIRQGETSQNDTAYATMFGGGRFEGFEAHPNIKNSAAGLTSTAAGAYQFLYRTWQGLVEQYGFTDFSPATQDLAAVALIKGRGALDDVVAGNFEVAIQKCAKEWASLPGSPYGQPTRTLEQARSVYEAFGGVYLPASASKPATEPVEAPKSIKEHKPMAPLFITLALQAISAFMPKVRELFPGSEVADRNMKTAEAIVNIAKDAVGATNEQDLVDKLKNDPTAANIVEKAVQDNWFGIVEVGGGIAAARTAALEMTKAEVSFWKNPAFIFTLMLMLPVYAVIASVLGILGHSDWGPDVRMLVMGLISNVVSGSMGFWLGSSFGSQKKNDLLNSK